MIHDSLDSATTRFIEQKFPALMQAFDWLRAMPAEPPEGFTTLCGNEMYIYVHGYQTLDAEDCQWESHRETVDIQFCIAGGEIIEWLPTGVLAPVQDFVLAKDTEHWHDHGAPTTQLRMFPGTYAMFLPHELHRPKLKDGTNDHIRKLVIKIRSSLLQD